MHIEPESLAFLSSSCDSIMPKGRSANDQE
ncbi:hypothetical protein Gorai_014612 [Gossypium raimondii]|uniref:Uncharacterized protein n=1 Tax=Gossypium raimondii TaxID=29730 RepID=A0A7J8P3P6_GOSRA|nr:hypothetical protein [Gossypium raimondii]